MKYLEMSKANKLVAIFLSVFLGVTQVFYSQASSDFEQDNPIIPRDVLFGALSKEEVKLSPTGKKISFMALKEGVRNIYVSDVNDIDNAKPITLSNIRDVSYDYYWSSDGEYIIFKGDNGGDENFSFRSVNIHTGMIKSLSPMGNFRTQFYAQSISDSKHIVLGFNNRDPYFFDLYKVNIETGTRQLLYENTDGFDRFYIDQDLNLRMGRKPSKGTPFYELYKFDSSKENTYSFFYKIELEESRTYKILQFDLSNKHFYALDNKETDKLALLKIDIESGERHLLALSPKVDIETVLFSPVTGEPIAYKEDYLKPKWHWLLGSKKNYMLPKQFFSERIDINSISNDGRYWLIRVQGKNPSRIYLVDQEEVDKPKLIFSERKELEAYSLSETKPVLIKTRDGLEMVSYLTLPKGSDKNNDGIPDKPLPMILNAHDGPWIRNRYSCDIWWQFMVNRGYAVLSPNFRGSTGFGKDFLNAGNMEWGNKMQNDLDDAVDWAVEKGIADPNSVAMFGASYSGYTGLMALGKTPDKYACVVDLFGASNLETLLNSLPKYWMVEFEEIVKRMGDPRTKKGRDFLKERSPITYVNNFKKPLLIVQGENDVRVNKKESDQIVKALETKAIPIVYMLLKNEGHGRFGYSTQIAMMASIEIFLSKYLGGRFEPFNDDFEKTNIIFKKGGELIKA